MKKLIKYITSFKNLRLPYKLSISYSAVFVLAVIIVSCLIYPYVNKTIGANIEIGLRNSTDSLLKMVTTSAAVSIKNRLRAVAEKNREIIKHFYEMAKRGEISENEAKSRARNILLSQTIGKTGYLFVWDISRAPEVIPLAVHPKIEGQDVAYVDFVQTGASLKNGYLEYSWKNPGEKKAREKAMYLSYFEPWQWVIAASSYKTEFKELINVEDFRQSILSSRFGETGFSYIIDSKGNIILHPVLKGNIYNSTDIKGRFFVQEICSKKYGKIKYLWKDSEEYPPRERIVIFNYIPDYDWIVASSGYIDEFHAPLEIVPKVILAFTLLVLLLVLPLSFRISSSITKPLQVMTKRLATGPSEKYSTRIKERSADEVGQLAKYFNIFMDRLEAYRMNLQAEIRERKLTEKVLRKSEEKYRTILESIEEGYFEVDLPGNLTFFNNSLCRHTGYPPEELLGKNNRDFSPPTSYKKMYQFFNKVYKTGEPAILTDYEINKKDGTRATVEISTSLMNDETGKPIGFRGIVRDVTMRKLAEKALIDSEERYRQLYEKAKKDEEIYRSLIHSSADAIVMYDMKLKVRYISPSFTQIFGWEIEDVEGKSIPFIPDSENERTEEIIKALVQYGIPCRGFETKRYTKDGRLLEVSISASCYEDHEGNRAGILAIMRDATETKKLHAQLQHAQRMESIGTIASGVAHNFRNILAGISVNSQLLQMKEPSNPAVLEATERINTSVTRGSRLVSGLMQFARKQETDRFKTVNLADIIQDTCDLVRKSFDKKIEVKVDLAKKLLIAADTAGLNQVIMNLSTNARDAMPNGGVLSIKAKKVSEHAELTITDTGHGMDEETIKKCFDPFFTSKEVDRGTGLGLSTSYGIIKKHGGSINVDSEPGRGTTFTVLLPLASSEKKRGRKIFPKTIRGNGQRILIVDDESYVLDPLRELLEGIGYTARYSTSGEKAISDYKSWNPDAVLMDRNMPKMDGITCAEEILKHDPTAKIILLSGYDEEGPDGIESRIRCLVSGYLTKPVDTVELAQTLAGIFGQ